VNGIDPVHNCLTCRYHEVQPVAQPDGTPVIGKEQPVCKRFPPTVVSMQIPTPQGVQVSLMPIFPAVNPSMWCWEHEPESGAEDVSD